MGRGSSAQVETILYGDHSRQRNSTYDCTISDDDMFGLTPHPGGIDGRISRKVLEKLGLNIDIPIERSELGYKIFLPELAKKKQSLYSALRDSQMGADGTIQSKRPGAELNWLIPQLKISGNSEWEVWNKHWQEALIESKLEKDPGELNLEARTFFVKRLADGGGPYALAEAMKQQAEISARAIQSTR